VDLHNALAEQRGLQILAFPCNQFASQEPQGAAEIETGIKTKFLADVQSNVAGFRLMEKVNVNGPETHHVYRWLRLKGSPDAEAIPWNFNMFLVGLDGETCTRYSNSRTPSSIKADIESALAGKPLPKPEGPPDVEESPASVVPPT